MENIYKIKPTKFDREDFSYLGHARLDFYEKKEEEQITQDNQKKQEGQEKQPKRKYILHKGRKNESEEEKIPDTFLPLYSKKQKKEMQKEHEKSSKERNKNLIGGVYKKDRKRKKDDVIGYLSDEFDNDLIVYDPGAFSQLFYSEKGYVRVDTEGREDFVKVYRPNFFILWWILGFVALLVAGIFLFNPIKDIVVPSFTPPDNVIEGPLKDLPQDEIQKLLQEKVDKDKLAMSINVSPSNEAGKNAYLFQIENSLQNQNNFHVEVTREADGELIYRSPTLQPGQHIKEDTILLKLPVGTVKALATFYSTDPDTGELIGKSTIAIKMVTR